MNIACLATEIFNLKRERQQGSGFRSYKVYKILLNQSGIDAPVATIFENTLDGIPIWTRSNTGVYNLTLSGAFPDGNKIFSSYQDRRKFPYYWDDEDGIYSMRQQWIDVNTLRISTYLLATLASPDAVLSDSLLFNTQIGLEIYP